MAEGLIRAYDRSRHQRRRLLPKIQSIAVFCGASAGHSAIYRAAAIELGQGLAQAGIRIVYGGGRIGLMGAVADAAMAAGGTVVGVIPEFLKRVEIANMEVADLIVTDSMHSRKQRMFEMSDAFITFAGGLGTLDETFEILTWRQLGLHDKPILICDIAGSAQPLVALIDAAIEQGFAKPDVRELFEVTNGVQATLDHVRRSSAPAGADAADQSASRL